MPSQTEQMVPRKNGGTEAHGRQGTQLARWNPFALLDELQDELARLWGRPFGSRALLRPSRLLAQLPLGAPRLDAFEKDGYLVIKADLPGVKKEDVQVEVSTSWPAVSDLLSKVINESDAALAGGVQPWDSGYKANSWPCSAAAPTGAHRGRVAGHCKAAGQQQVAHAHHVTHRQPGRLRQDVAQPRPANASTGRRTRTVMENGRFSRENMV
jgi:hypothetical protein